ncbi:hypothetical protein [Calothrix sp. UHCC 0171]|uniref:hypothetical protein n=1 Tax=Calothrix sp. UHCC 0171 TaxID=3110245 RepID=UPI002B219A7F|nr:hypothetical protein [Calothrix sp. UHCC 0171]MEA5569677.1 hypothetical protein [Calothrix sp. UHCC 0171]
MIAIIPVAGVSTLLFLSQKTLKQEQWLPVQNGITYGISGMTVLQQQDNSLDLLVVHDNKKPNQGRLGIVKIQGNNLPEYIPLQWQKNTKLPIDLESLTLVPTKELANKNQASHMALSSSGQVYHFSFASDNTISIIKIFALPGLNKDSNLEAFALQEIDNKLIAVWAERGEGEKPAIMYWGILDLATYKINLAGYNPIKVPLKSPNLRHISDLKVDNSGVIYITSATDNGNDGPFESAVYIIGSLSVQNQQIIFQPKSAITGVGNYDKHKIEAMEFLPHKKGGIVFGTDDENKGSSILIKLN